MGKYSIGIDLGGTKILTSIVDKKNGEVVSFVKKKTKKEKGCEKIVHKIINSVTGNTLVNADVVCNTAYMDFLANASGLNIGKMELGRRVEMMYYLTNAAVTRIPSNINLALDQAISKSIGRLYQVLN